MADETIDTQNERADLEPTPEELQAAEIAKTQQALALVNAAKQEEASIAPLTLIAPPRNRTYMGPNIGGPTNPQEFFGPSLPAGRVIVPPAMRTPAPLTPEAQSALQSRIAAATQPESDTAALARTQALDRPGTRTIGVSRPPMPVPSAGEMQFEAQQGYLKDVQGGMPIAQARDKWLPLMLSGKAPLGMLTENQRLNTAMRQQQLDQQAKAQSDRMALLSKPKLSAVQQAELNSGLAQFRADEAAGRKALATAQKAFTVAGNDKEVSQATEMGRLAADDIRKAQKGRQQLINRFSTNAPTPVTPTATGTTAAIKPPEKPKRPTRTMAKEYVSRYGADAKSKLQAEGYDVSGYAD